MVGLFARAYDVLKDEGQHRRSITLEAIIVVLIAFEILMALRGP